ncbi:hypothetical protein C9974_16270 [Marinobacter sp. B9-2]|nr:hypothetical protein C9974_16270 [Marinobacter sp. B9-2]
MVKKIYLVTNFIFVFKYKRGFSKGGTPFDSLIIIYKKWLRQKRLLKDIEVKEDGLQILRL